MNCVLCPVLPPSAPLDVQNINMCQDLNKPKHYTTDYNTPNLVVRRGQEFLMNVTFNRPLAQGDDFHIEFQIGESGSWGPSSRCEL